jgi:hypothetical protein
MLGQVGGAPRLCEPFGEPDGEFLVNVIGGHGTRI